MQKWKINNQKVVYNTKFMQVFEEEVVLENGVIIPDFSLVKKPDIVVIVATVEGSNIIMVEEYKHGAQEILQVLPAGHLKPDEDPIEAGKRELLEETGYTSKNWKFIQHLFDYPSKDRHKVSVVMATECVHKKDQQLDENEVINYKTISLNELQKLISSNQISSSSTLAALLVSGVLK